MSDHDAFPDVRDKLSAPSKKSAFEKARLEAEAKRQREEAETAAVYRDFVASFDDDNNNSSAAPVSFPGGGGSSGSRGGIGSARGSLRGAPPSGPGRRHFTGPPGRGRGGIGGGVGGVGGGGIPPPQKKRNLESAFERDEDEAGVFGGQLSAGEKRRMKESNTGLLAFENSVPKGRDRYDDDDSDSDSAKPHPKPTVHLSSLPPNTTKAALTALFASTPLKIDSIVIIPAPPPPGPSQPSPSIRKAASALITLSSETPSSDIDAAVSALNGRYLGTGFWLSITRHLSSTGIGAIPASLGSAGTQSNAFGAVAPRPTGPIGGGGRGGPHRGGFAPPPSFGGRAQGVSGLQVHVTPPQDLKTLKLIHKTVENVLQHGVEFEALLMANEGVKKDPKFAWLWDARSPAGVYYRWKLWEIVTGFGISPAARSGKANAVEVFEPTLAAAALWIPPKRPLKYEWAGSLKEVVEDEGFASDELDEDDSDRENEHEDRPIGLSGGDGKKGRGYLGVLDRAKLIHLISRLPTQTSKVRRGDVGRVMAFAMEHAEGGMGEEVVDVLVSNVLNPLQFSAAAKAAPSPSSSASNSDAEGTPMRKKRSDEPPPPPPPSGPTDSTSNAPNAPNANTKDGSSSSDAPDTSAAKIIALWLISDVLSNSSLGVRAAWRYRQLFDSALRDRGVFRHLGDMYRRSGWGRMKAEKFRRGIVDGVLDGWEKWCIFPQSSQETFLRHFLNPDEGLLLPPLPEDVGRERRGASGSATPGEREREREEGPVEGARKRKSAWKTVDAAPAAFNPNANVEDVDGAPMEEDVDGEPMEDVDGEPMEDVDGEPMEEDVDGEPMESDPDPAPEPETGRKEKTPPPPADPKPTLSGAGFGITAGFKVGGSGGGAAPKRKRPKAEDMFADDDD